MLKNTNFRDLNNKKKKNNFFSIDFDRFVVLIIMDSSVILVVAPRAENEKIQSDIQIIRVDDLLKTNGCL